MAKLTEGKLAKIQLLINQGFSNGEIARALKVSDESVRKYRSGSNKNVKNRNDKIDKGSRNDDNSSMQRGPGNSSNSVNQEGSGKSEFDDPNNNAGGESTPAGTKTGGGITFIGGKKNMSKKEGSEAKEENEYQCYNCDHIQGSPFSDCPKCGSVNSFEE